MDVPDVHYLFRHDLCSVHVLLDDVVVRVVVVLVIDVVLHLHIVDVVNVVVLHCVHWLFDHMLVHNLLLLDSRCMCVVMHDVVVDVSFLEGLSDLRLSDCVVESLRTRVHEGGSSACECTCVVHVRLSGCRHEGSGGRRKSRIACPTGPAISSAPCQLHRGGRVAATASRTVAGLVHMGTAVKVTVSTPVPQSRGRVVGSHRDWRGCLDFDDFVCREHDSRCLHASARGRQTFPPPAASAHWRLCIHD
mmetsp:Transcript_23746/g.46652  ORF Transcript_23746/g.46652 Transcript_23746/m.46652 type:complete len:248 (-) Transcript_23746:80-823(-)